MTDRVDCDICSEPAAFLVYAAYDVASEDVHPRLARYPAPMIRVCGPDLVEQLQYDSRSEHSTRQYVVRLLRDGRIDYGPQFGGPGDDDDPEDSDEFFGPTPL